MAAERFVSIIANTDNQFALGNSTPGRHYANKFDNGLVPLDEFASLVARMVARRIDEALDVVTSPDPSAFALAFNTARSAVGVPWLEVNVQRGGVAPSTERVIATWHYNTLLGEWACTTF